MQPFICLSVRRPWMFGAIVLFSAVASAQTAPLTISGTPKSTATVDQYYSFRPTTSGRDRWRLRFTVTGKPSWATLSPYSGTLYGVPRTSHIGTYSNIVITVTDGKTSAKLPAFSIKVVAPGAAPAPTPTPTPTPAPTPPPPSAGNATVSWAPPTQNTNGSTLTNLAGYRILYGKTRGGPYSSNITLTNPSLSTYVVENLTAGTYYFVVTARNSTGVESAYSNEASKTIN